MSPIYYSAQSNVGIYEAEAESESTKRSVFALAWNKNIEYEERSIRAFRKSMQFDGGTERSYPFYILLKSELGAESEAVSGAESGAESEAVFLS